MAHAKQSEILLILGEDFRVRPLILIKSKLMVLIIITAKLFPHPELSTISECHIIIPKQISLVTQQCQPHRFRFYLVWNIW